MKERVNLRKLNDEEGDEDEDDISSQYLNPEQIKVYLEACLNKRVYNFTIETEINEDLYDSKKFEKIKAEKVFKNFENLFYRIWIYQYDGLKEYYNIGDKKTEYKSSKDQGDKGNKKLSTFKFSLGTINLEELQRENLNLRKKLENPNMNLDEFNPKAEEIKAVRKGLKIIFIYANIGRPLLQEDIEIEKCLETKKKNPSQESFDFTEPKYLFKYEFDPDKVVYLHCIKFDLDEYIGKSQEEITRIEDDIQYCRELETEKNSLGLIDQMCWEFVSSDQQNRKIQKVCEKCFKKYATKKEDGGSKLADIVILSNSKYSIRYFNYCKERNHYTKKYEYYCNDCNKAYCIYCLLADHKDPNGTHELVEVKSKDIFSFSSNYTQKIASINLKEKKNYSIWEEIDARGDKAEVSLRERQKQAIIDVKTEIMERCLFLTSVGFELERIIEEVERKKKFIQFCRENSNVANYFCMSYMFQRDLMEHYQKNLEILEKMDLDAFVQTFHKIDKKVKKKNI